MRNISFFILGAALIVAAIFARSRVANAAPGPSMVDEDSADTAMADIASHQGGQIDSWQGDMAQIIADDSSETESDRAPVVEVDTYVEWQADQSSAASYGEYALALSPSVPIPTPAMTQGQTQGTGANQGDDYIPEVGDGETDQPDTPDVQYGYLESTEDVATVETKQVTPRPTRNVSAALATKLAKKKLPLGFL